MIYPLILKTEAVYSSKMSGSLKTTVFTVTATRMSIYRSLITFIYSFIFKYETINEAVAIL
jgi:hypothetical protein